METEKKNSSIVIIVILAILVVVLGGYIVFDKVLNNKTNNETEEKSNNETKPVETPVENQNETKTVETGECPLTKLNDYELTEADIDDIIASIESLNIGFTKDTIDRSTFKKGSVGESGYSMSVPFKAIPDTSGTYATVTRVNGKFKVLNVGSGDTVEGSKRMENTLISICR